MSKREHDITQKNLKYFITKHDSQQKQKDRSTLKTGNESLLNKVQRKVILYVTALSIADNIKKAKRLPYQILKLFNQNFRMKLK